MSDHDNVDNHGLAPNENEGETVNIFHNLATAANLILVIDNPANTNGEAYAPFEVVEDQGGQAAGLSDSDDDMDEPEDEPGSDLDDESGSDLDEEFGFDFDDDEDQLVHY